MPFKNVPWPPPNVAGDISQCSMEDGVLRVRVQALLTRNMDGTTLVKRAKEEPGETMSMCCKVSRDWMSRVVVTDSHKHSRLT